MNRNINIVLPDHELNNDESLYITRAGYYDKPSDHQIQRDHGEIPKEAIIIYCLKGEGWLKTDTFYKAVLPGTFLFCDKGVAHSYGANPNNPWVIYWAHFGGSFVDYFSSQLSLTGCADIQAIGDITQIEDDMLNVIEQLHQSQDPNYRHMSYTYLKRAMLNTLLAVKESKRISTENHLSKQVIKLMKKHLNDTLTLDEITAYFGLSKYHFIRKFKKETGLSPINYYNQLKIEQTKILLITTDDTISEISRILNFNTPYYFSEVFKQHTSFSPRDYRKLHKKHY